MCYSEWSMNQRHQYQLEIYQKCRTSSSTPDLLSQDLCFYKIPRWVIGTLELKRYWSRESLAFKTITKEIAKGIRGSHSEDLCFWWGWEENEKGETGMCPLLREGVARSGSVKSRMARNWRVTKSTSCVQRFLVLRWGTMGIGTYVKWWNWQMTKDGSRDGLDPSRLLSLLSSNYMGSLSSLDRKDFFPFGSPTSSILPFQLLCWILFQLSLPVVDA